jgi:hypothetical protein
MFNIALLHEYRNEYGEAYKLYKLILQINPYFIEADIKLGELAKLRGNKDKAIEYMKSAIDKHFYKEKSENENEKVNENENGEKINKENDTNNFNFNEKEANLKSGKNQNQNSLMLNNLTAQIKNNNRKKINK